MLSTYGTILIRRWHKFFISSYQHLLERFSSICMTFRSIQKSSHDEAQLKKLTNMWVQSLALALTMSVIQNKLLNTSYPWCPCP